MNFLLHNCFCFILELKIPYQSIPCFFIFKHLVCVADRRAFQNISLKDFEVLKELFGNLYECIGQSILSYILHFWGWHPE